MEVFPFIGKGRALAVAGAIAVFGSYNAHAVDADAALSLARRENCLKCHAIEKQKDGPPYREVAEKHRGEADAEAKLIEHIKSGKMVKMANGDEEEHRVIKTNDEEAIRNLVQWILSQ